MQPYKIIAFFSSGYPHDGDFWVALHSRDTFHNEDMRKDFYIQDHGLEFYVDYEVVQEMSRNVSGALTCHNNYRFDAECIYRKLEDIAAQMGCTVPWALNNTGVCADPKDARKAMDLVQQITDVDINNCPKACSTMPIQGEEWTIFSCFEMHNLSLVP